MLLVDPVIPGNAGTYTCSVRNLAGNSTSSTTLRVLGDFIKLNAHNSGLKVMMLKRGAKLSMEYNSIIA
jgi:hypothetical protein